MGDCWRCLLIIVSINSVTIAVSKGILEEFIQKFVKPKQILSDNG